MDKTQVNEEQENLKEVLENQEEAAASQEQEQPAGQTGEENNDMVKLQEEVASAKDKYLRLYSEFENFRRRTSKEKLELIQSANEQLILSLLPVLDDFERAQKALEDKTTPEIEGLLLIHQKLRKILEIHGVKAMEISPGTTAFDTDVHEAVTQVPGEESMKNKVVDVLENGYFLNDKVIRFAKVVVGG